MDSNDDDARFLSSLLDAVSRPRKTDYIQTYDDDDDNIEDVFKTRAGNKAKHETSGRRGGEFRSMPTNRASMMSSATAATAADYRSLTRFLVAEKSVSTLLPWPAALAGRVMARLEKQVAKTERMQAELEEGIDDLSSTTNNRNNNNKTNNAIYAQRFVLVAMETDLERYKFLIRALLRTRLSKISQYGLVWLRRDDDTLAEAGISPSTSVDDDFSATTSLLPILLSPEERSFALAHSALLEQHALATCLDRFPPSFRRLDDNIAGLDMLQGPDEEECVIIRVLEGEGDNDDVSKDKDGDRSLFDDDDDDDFSRKERVTSEWRRGDIWILQWKQVKREWERGRIELL